MYKDFFEYKSDVLNMSVARSSLPVGLQNLIDRNGGFVLPSFGRYQVNLKYFLPGDLHPHRTSTIDINYGNTN